MSAILRPFNTALKLTHRHVSSIHSTEIIRETTANMLVDRIENDMTHEFHSMVDLGWHRGAIWNEIYNNSNNNTNSRLKNTLKEIILMDHENSYQNKILEEIKSQSKQLDMGVKHLPIPSHNNDFLHNICPQILSPSSVDLIVSNCILHNVNDLPGLFKQIKLALKPDGAFIGCMLGGETLFELRNALAIAQQEREGGLSPHISPTIQPADVCGLLNSAGLVLSTVDTNTISIEYDSIYSCMRDLWWMGETYSPANGKPSPIHRETFMAAGIAALRMFNNANNKEQQQQQSSPVFPVTFEVISMIGWCPSPTQPKPLKPSIPQVSFSKLGIQKK
jgi:SAM-dependent methyltransferase